MEYLVATRPLPADHMPIHHMRQMRQPVADQAHPMMMVKQPKDAKVAHPMWRPEAKVVPVHAVVASPEHLQHLSKLGTKIGTIAGKVGTVAGGIGQIASVFII